MDTKIVTGKSGIPAPFSFFVSTSEALEMEGSRFHSNVASLGLPQWISSEISFSVFDDFSALVCSKRIDDSSPENDTVAVAVVSLVLSSQMIPFDPFSVVVSVSFSLKGQQKQAPREKPAKEFCHQTDENIDMLPE